MSWSPHGIGYYWRILPALSRLFYQKITLLSFHIFSIRQEGMHLFQAYSNFSCQITFCSSTFSYFDNFSSFFNIRRICYIAPERFKTRTITVEAATNPTLSTSIISDETPEADGEGDGELLPSMDIFSGIKSLNTFYVQFQTRKYYFLVSKISHERRFCMFFFSFYHIGCRLYLCRIFAVIKLKKN